ncbi:hypothetical protein [Chengkuizengella marina]|uniref:Uncharacterized protein n=1 Tax=Chengkuizengella marina TaxID=2507566 RepID=A0A6N9Q4F9_9BACL|nr:hypothetical protein [Chengkuizengella marina]NBI29697.1 hypothetical protein [Chengkuizengella marina]
MQPALVEMESTQKYSQIIDMLQISVIDLQTQREILLTPHQNVFYSLNDVEAKSLYNFTIESGESYRVVTDTEALPHHEIKLTIFHNLLGSLFSVLVSIGITLIVTALLVAISFIIKWRTRKK